MEAIGKNAGDDARKSRVEWLDIAKGLAIICVIVGHTAVSGEGIRNLIFSFHLPLFFIIAGFTIKRISMTEIKQSLKKDFMRLILPVFLMRSINLAISMIFYHEPFAETFLINIYSILWGNGNDYVPFSSSFKFWGVGEIWFLIALFWAKLLYRIFDNYIIHYRFIVLLLLAFGGMWTGSVVRLPQCMDMMPLILLFMECGRYLRNEVDMQSKAWEKTGVAAFFIWIFLVWNKEIYIEMATREYPYFMVSVLLAVLGSIVVIQFSQALGQLRWSKALAFLGRNSLILLCIHHLDWYVPQLWTVTIFKEGSSLIFVNDMATFVARVLFDIVLMMGVVFINNKMKRSHRGSQNC